MAGKEATAAGKEAAAVRSTTARRRPVSKAVSSTAAGRREERGGVGRQAQLACRVAGVREGEVRERAACHITDLVNRARDGPMSVAR